MNLTAIQGLLPGQSFAMQRQLPKSSFRERSISRLAPMVQSEFGTKPVLWQTEVTKVCMRTCRRLALAARTSWNWQLAAGTPLRTGSDVAPTLADADRVPLE
jgi:hypothetical protein